MPVGALTFRLKGGYFAVGSWLVAEVFRLLFGNSDYLGNASGLFIRQARNVDPWLVYYVAVGLLIGMVALVVMTLRSRLGLALMAIRDAEDAAASLGVHVWRVKLLAFVVAAAGTALVASALDGADAVHPAQRGVLDRVVGGGQLHGRGRRPRHGRGPAPRRRGLRRPAAAARQQRRDPPDRPGRRLGGR